jgi:hypothetical protein
MKAERERKQNECTSDFIPLSFNGIDKVAVAVQRLQQLYQCR